jgi:hypothetical protein
MRETCLVASVQQSMCKGPGSLGFFFCFVFLVLFSFLNVGFEGFM